MNTSTRLPEITIDATALYREEVITDRKVGILRVLTPLTAEGTPDASRSLVFIGEAQLMTSIGALPVPFEIPGANLAEAIQNFNSAAKEAVERTVAELQEMRRQAASSLVIPPTGANLGGGGFGGMGGGGFGGMGGGGKIQMP